MRYFALCFALAATSTLASAGCVPILGTVKLTQDPGCAVATFPGMQGQPFVGECYKDVLKLGGLVPAYGYSGVTSEMISSLLSGGGEARSPAIAQGGRTLLTARSTFSLGGTRLYAAEVILDSGSGLVTEQSVITGTDGKGLFKNATGGFTILGNSIGETAHMQGQICIP